MPQTWLRESRLLPGNEVLLGRVEVEIPLLRIRIEPAYDGIVRPRDQLLQHLTLRECATARQTSKGKIGFGAYPHVQSPLSVAFLARCRTPCSISGLPLCCRLCHLAPPNHRYPVTHPHYNVTR